MDTTDLTKPEALALMDTPEGSWGTIIREGHPYAWLRAHGGLHLTHNDCHGDDTAEMVFELPRPVRIVTATGTVTLDEAGDDLELWLDVVSAALSELPDYAVVVAGQLHNPQFSSDFALATLVDGVWLVSGCAPGLHYEARELLFENEPGASLYDEGKDDSALIHERSLTFGIPDTVTVLHRA